MSEPVAPSLQSENQLTVRSEPVPKASDPLSGKPDVESTLEGSGVRASIDSARTEVTELEHAVDTVLLKRIFEAALLSSQEPLSITELKRLADVPLETGFIEELLTQLAEKYSDSGVELNRVASGWRFRARPELQDHLDKLNPQKPPRYSRAVMETLAIIAYRQPVTRGDIEEIRGVTVSAQVLKTLEGRSWIEVIGTRDTPGKPELFATTQQLLDDLNLHSLGQLPALEEMGSLLDQSGSADN